MPGIYIVPAPPVKDALIKKYVIRKIIRRWLNPSELEVVQNFMTEEVFVEFLTDVFYLHYYPFSAVRDYPLNGFREVLRQYLKEYSSSRPFKALRKLTRFDEDVSYLATVIFAKELIRSLLRPLMTPKYSKQSKISWAAVKDILRSVHFHAKCVRYNVQNTMKLASLMRAWGVEPGLLKFGLEVDTLRVMFAEKVFEFVKGIEKAISKRSSEKRPWLFGNSFGDYIQTRNPLMADYLDVGVSLLVEEYYLVKALFGWRLKRKKLRRSGTLILLVDKSGSMTGEPTAWARSIGIVLVRQAWKMGWDSYVALFDTKTSDFYSDRQDQLKALLKVEPGGGTNIQRAVLKAIDFAKENGIRSPLIVVVTDEIAPFNAEEVRTAKSTVGAKLVLISVFGSENPELRKAADEVFIAKSPTVESALITLERIRSRFLQAS